MVAVCVCKCWNMEMEKSILNSEYIKMQKITTRFDKMTSIEFLHEIKKRARTARILSKIYTLT